jgi:hypothetical protein
VSNPNQPNEVKVPERIWLPADTDADSWNILAKNPFLQETIEFIRASVAKKEVEAMKAAMIEAVGKAADECPVFVFHSPQGMNFLMAALEKVGLTK